jgi:hypothetical protein
VRFYVSMFNTLLHHQKSRLVSILNLVMIDLFCLYVVGVHSFLCLSVGAQVWTILVVFSRNLLKCALIYTVGICLKTPLKIMQSRSVEKRLRLGQERCYVDVFLE